MRRRLLVAGAGMRAPLAAARPAPLRTTGRNGWTWNALVVGLAAATLAAATIAACARSARADGDPASDVLYSEQLFLPYDVSFPPRLQAQLRQLLAAGARTGYPIRVAVVATAYDLGSIGELWRKPQLYARFLGTELSLVYHGRLLIVMPNGFGLYRGGSPVALERRSLDTVTIAPGGAGLARAAIIAVRQLAAAAGHPLTLPQPQPTKVPAVTAASHRLRNLLVIAAGVMLMLLVWAISLRLRPLRRPSTGGREGRRHRTRSTRRVVRLPGRIRPVWPLIALLGTLVLIANVAFALAERKTSHAGAASAHALAPDVTWSAGARPAAAFTLIDQHARPVSVPSGRTTILTFIDPLCRNYCPLEARVLDRTINQLPAGSRPQIVAVSVNPAADTRANLALDHRKWRLSPQWRWAIGEPTALARIWHAYGITVQVVPQHTLGITIQKIVHTEATYLIDRHGFQRALYLWPFKTAAVAAGVRRLEAETHGG